MEKKKGIILIKDKENKNKNLKVLEKKMFKLIFQIKIYKLISNVKENEKKNNVLHMM